MEKLLCPLLAAQLEEVSAAQECRMEKCAWYIQPDKSYGTPACAIHKIAAALLRK